MTFDPVETERLLYLAFTTRDVMARAAVNAAAAAERCQPGIDHAVQLVLYHFACGEFDVHNAIIERHATGAMVH